MADSSGAQQRPRSLKVFLDAGGDLTAPDIWEERLAEVVSLDLPLAPPGERARRAADARAKALKAGTRRCGWRRRDRVVADMEAGLEHLCVGGRDATPVTAKRGRHVRDLLSRSSSMRSILLPTAASLLSKMTSSIRPNKDLLAAAPSG